MKNKIRNFACAVLFSLLSSCSNPSTSAPVSRPKSEEDSKTSLKTSPTTGKENRASIVCYFSCTGTTEKVAKKIQSFLSSDLYHIEPETPYTSADLNYNDTNSRVSKENNDPTSRPKIKGEKQDFRCYTDIYLGYPIWWNKMPKILYTFLDTYDFKGKNIYPFCTSASTSISNSVNDLRNMEKESNVDSGRRFSSSSSDSEIKDWVDSTRK